MRERDSFAAMEWEWWAFLVQLPWHATRMWRVFLLFKQGSRDSLIGAQNAVSRFSKNQKKSKIIYGQKRDHTLKREGFSLHRRVHHNFGCWWLRYITVHVRYCILTETTDTYYCTVSNVIMLLQSWCPSREIDDNWNWRGVTLHFDRWNQFFRFFF